jgi:hypothetical protein
MHAVNGIKFAKQSSAGRFARGLVAGFQKRISDKRLRRAPVLALIILALLGIVTSAYLSGRSVGKEQAQAALGHRLADATRDPLSLLLARSPGVRGDDLRLTKVAPVERASDVTHARQPDSRFIPAAYYGPGGEPDDLSDVLGTPKAGGDSTDFGPPSLSFDAPGNVLIPGGGSSGGGGGSPGGSGGSPGGPGGTPSGPGGTPSGPSGPPGGPNGGGGGIPPSPVPEPSTWAFLIVGFLGIGIAARRLRRGAAIRTVPIGI